MGYKVFSVILVAFFVAAFAVSVYDEEDLEDNEIDEYGHRKGKICEYE